VVKPRRLVSAAVIDDNQHLIGPVSVPRYVQNMRRKFSESRPGRVCRETHRQLPMRLWAVPAWESRWRIQPRELVLR
jgi:hypothetical protein